MAGNKKNPPDLLRRVYDIFIATAYHYLLA
jgi:hypothetical protein